MAMLPTLPPGVVRVIAATNASGAATVAEGGTGAVVIEWTESYLTALRTALNITAESAFGSLLFAAEARGYNFAPLTADAADNTSYIEYDAGQIRVVPSASTSDETLVVSVIWTVPYLGVQEATSASVAIWANYREDSGTPGSPAGNVALTASYCVPGDDGALVALTVTPDTLQALTDTLAEYIFSVDMSTAPLGSVVVLQFDFDFTEVGGTGTVGFVTTGGSITATA